MKVATNNRISSMDGEGQTTSRVDAKLDPATEDDINLEISRVDDPLLECLVTLGKIYHKPLAKEALIAGLPLVDNRLTPKLFLRSAPTAGFSARIVKRSFEKIPTLALPVILLLEGNGNIRASPYSSNPSLTSTADPNLAPKPLIPKTGFGERSGSTRRSTPMFYLQRSSSICSP